MLHLPFQRRESPGGRCLLPRQAAWLPFSPVISAVLTMLQPAARQRCSRSGVLLASRGWMASETTATGFPRRNRPSTAFITQIYVTTP